MIYQYSAYDSINYCGNQLTNFANINMFPHPDNVNVNVEISEKNMKYSTSAID